MTWWSYTFEMRRGGPQMIFLADRKLGCWGHQIRVYGKFGKWQLWGRYLNLYLGLNPKLENQKCVFLSYPSFKVLDCVCCYIMHFVNQMSCFSLMIIVFVPPDDIISRYYIVTIFHGAVKWCKDTTRTSILLNIENIIKTFSIIRRFYLSRY